VQSEPAGGTHLGAIPVVAPAQPAAERERRSDRRPLRAGRDLPQRARVQIDRDGRRDAQPTQPGADPGFDRAGQRLPPARFPAQVRHERAQDERAVDPADAIERREIRQIVLNLVRSLPTTDRLIIMLYYYDRLTMKQIGQIINISESRICQVHTDLINRLQRKLKRRKDELAAHV